MATTDEATPLAAAASPNPPTRLGKGKISVLLALALGLVGVGALKAQGTGTIANSTYQLFYSEDLDAPSGDGSIAPCIPKRDAPKPNSCSDLNKQDCDGQQICDWYDPGYWNTVHDGSCTLIDSAGMTIAESKADNTCYLLREFDCRYDPKATICKWWGSDSWAPS